MAARPDQDGVKSPSGRSAEELPRMSPNPATDDALSDPEHAALPAEEAELKDDAGLHKPH